MIRHRDSLEETDTELIGYLTIGIIPEIYDEADKASRNRSI